VEDATLLAPACHQGDVVRERALLQDECGKRQIAAQQIPTYPANRSDRHSVLGREALVPPVDRLIEEDAQRLLASLASREGFAPLQAQRTELSP
jgi:hypothetical protein